MTLASHARGPEFEPRCEYFWPVVPAGIDETTVVFAGIDETTFVVAQNIFP